MYVIYTSISLIPFCPRYPFLPRMRFKRLFSHVFTLRSQKLDHLRVRFVASRTRLGGGGGMLSRNMAPRIL